MPVGGVGTKTGIDPKTQAAAKLSANLRNCFVRRLMIKAALSFFCRHRKKQELRHPVVLIFLNLSQCRRDIVPDGAAQSGPRFLIL